MSLDIKKIQRIEAEGRIESLVRLLRLAKLVSKKKAA